MQSQQQQQQQQQQSNNGSGIYTKVWRDDRPPPPPPARSRTATIDHHHHPASSYHHHHDWAQQRSSSTSRLSSNSMSNYQTLGSGASSASASRANSPSSAHHSASSDRQLLLSSQQQGPGGSGSQRGATSPNHYYCYEQPILETVMIVEVFFRVLLAIVNIELENMEPFTRKIHENELWLYKNPRVDSYVTTSVLWVAIILVPLIVISLVFYIQKEKNDFSQAVYSYTLSLGFTGVVTNILKIIVGRPRPDFFYRCFPDGNVNFDFECTGDPIAIRDGKKSFPSGHASLAFSGFGFVALYVAGKLHTFSWNGKGQSWKLFLFLFPLGIALTIAISRTCDYHHHWQDVLTGSLIGLAMTFLCYRHYYPPLDCLVCHKPYISLKKIEPKEMKTTRIELSRWT
ncbi:hypothetical protein TKK_0014931 [Trichogramma kaykai]|uniref:Phosphatidic acid phosphatase type 2/haloperoxidase domain-containing protein n=1 Tax=Trichogramma kaykai TaxID=54128 RepID=A0ABD2WBM4_9HYME